MIVLEMPSNSLEIEIYGKQYSIDIADFKALNVLRGLKLPKDVPGAEDMSDLTEQYQTAFAEILGERLSLPDSPDAAYFAARKAVVAVYWAIRDEQNKYLDINYRVKSDLQRRVEMSKMIAAARGGADEREPDTSTD